MNAVKEMSCSVRKAVSNSVPPANGSWRKSAICRAAALRPGNALSFCFRRFGFRFDVHNYRQLFYNECNKVENKGLDKFGREKTQVVGHDIRGYGRAHGHTPQPNEDRHKQAFN